MRVPCGGEVNKANKERHPVKEFQFELKMEREQSKQGGRNAPPSVQRNAAAKGQIDDPKPAVVLSFYEDLTNIIIPNVKPQPPQYLTEPEYDLHCVYTHAATDEQAGSQVRGMYRPIGIFLRLISDLYSTRVCPPPHV